MQAILTKLSPLSNNQPWGFILYTVLVLIFITMLLQKNAGLGITMLLSGVMLICVIDQVAPTSGSTAGYGSGSSENYFLPFMLRVAMFAIPLMVAGMTKSEKSRPFAILAFVIGVVYWLIRWTQIPK